MARNIIKSETLDYENPWLFNGKPFLSKDIGDYVGFVYVIKSKIDGKLYIGRKYFYSKRKPKGGGRRKTTESDWKKYYGSSDEMKRLVKEYSKDSFCRVILSLHTTEGDCNTEEVKQLFCWNVLENENFINDNIAGRWFRKSGHIVEARKYNEIDRVS